MNLKCRIFIYIALPKAEQSESHKILAIGKLQKTWFC